MRLDGKIVIVTVRQLRGWGRPARGRLRRKAAVGVVDIDLVCLSMR